MIESDPDAHLDLYFRQCSILANAVDIAFIGATLANGGTHPLTGRRALGADRVRDVLSVLTSCGMYDYAGEWELRVGLPAKSGVGGGIMVVLPGQLGICVFSPRLDERGNSLRGLKVCEDLAAALKLHLLDDRGSTRSALRRLYRGAEVRSTRLRPAAARDSCRLAGPFRGRIGTARPGSAFAHLTAPGPRPGARRAALKVRQSHGSGSGGGTRTSRDARARRG